MDFVTVKKNQAVFLVLVLAILIFSISTHEWYQSSQLTFGKKTDKHISQNTKLFLQRLSVLSVCIDGCYISAGFNHTVRALAPVKWKMLHFYGKSIMFVFTPTAITMSLISHSLHFHVWEGETGWGFGSKKQKPSTLLG